MLNKDSSAGANSSNKLLMLVLLVTVVATAWTAVKDDGSIDEASDELLVTKTSRTKIATNVQQNNTKIPSQNINTLSNSGKLIPWQSLKREPMSDKPVDLFKVHSWLVIPPVKKMKPEPPPVPVAPPVPFSYIGKLEDSPKGTQIFLMASGKLYSVVKGEKVNQQWRFDSEDANALRFTYLPFNLAQTLSKSAKQVAVAVTPVAVTESIQ